MGRATAVAFAERGWSVALLARGRERLEAAAKEVVAAGGRALVVPVDVADARAVEEAGAAVVAELGSVDVWVNNAMVSVFSPVSELTAEEVRRVAEVTYLGCVYGTLTALKQMRKQEGGTIVQVGSALAYRSIPLQAAYCGAKHAIVGFTDSLRTELLHDRSPIRVTQVHLPAMNTPQFDWVRSRLPRRPQPVPPIYQPEVAAIAVVWAAQRAPREVKVGWPTIGAVYAHRIAPGLLDAYLARTGIRSQQSHELPAVPARDNVFSPVADDVGAHGRFDDVARSRSWALQLRIAGGDLASTLLRR